MALDDLFGINKEKEVKTSLLDIKNYPKLELNFSETYYHQLDKFEKDHLQLIKSLKDCAIYRAPYNPTNKEGDYWLLERVYFSRRANSLQSTAYLSYYSKGKELLEITQAHYIDFYEDMGALHRIKLFLELKDIGGVEFYESLSAFYKNAGKYFIRGISDQIKSQ